MEGKQRGVHMLFENGFSSQMDVYNTLYALSVTNAKIDKLKYSQNLSY